MIVLVFHFGFLAINNTLRLLKNFSCKGIEVFQDMRTNHFRNLNKASNILDVSAVSSNIPVIWVVKGSKTFLVSNSNAEFVSLTHNAVSNGEGCY